MVICRLFVKKGPSITIRKTTSLRPIKVHCSSELCYFSFLSCEFFSDNLGAKLVVKEQSKNPIHHFWPQQTTSLASSQNMALTCVFFYLKRLSFYASKDTPVFSAFLDASKAFDRNNHNSLFAKLIKRNVPLCIVRLLLSWYRQQTMQVKWVPTTHPPLL